MTLIIMNIAIRSTILIMFSFSGKTEKERKSRMLSDHRRTVKKREELLKLETSIGTKPNGHELSMNKFSLEIRSRFLNTRGVKFLNGFPIGNNKSKSHFILRKRLIIYKGNPAT